MSKNKNLLQDNFPHAYRSALFSSIVPGDIIHHEKHGDGFIFYKDSRQIKVYFSNTYVKVFYGFDFHVMRLTHRWLSQSKAYSPPFCSYMFPPTPTSTHEAEFQNFIQVQNQTIKKSVDFLINSPDTTPLQHNIIQCIHLFFYTIRNIQLAELDYRTSPQKFHADKYTLPRRAILPDNFFSNDFAKPSPAHLNISFKSSTDTLYVYSGRIMCIRDKHNMVCANAHIETASGETAILNINCCLNCNRFYISYDEYVRYMEKYKSLLTRIVLVDENGNSSFTNNLAAESTLKLCGYTVSQEKGFTSKERANLLANIIHNHIVSKPDVIQHLNWLIRMNGKKVGNDIAKEKWEEDLAFVRNLDTNAQFDYQINHITPYSSSKKHRK